MTTTAETWQEPTENQIQVWKKEHDCEDIHVFAVKDDKDFDVNGKPKIKKAYFRTPDLSDFTRATQSEKAKAGTYLVSLFNNCLLTCHPDIKTKKRLYTGVIRMVGEIDAAAEVEIAKL